MSDGNVTRSERFRLWLESSAKFVASIVAAIAVVSAAIIGARYESKLTTVSLLSQREDAESRIRSSMFQTLVEPVTRLSPGTEVDPNRYLVLVNLLTLNFHDQFEVKPLLADADRILANEKNSSGRRALRSVARRVIDRQITSLSSTSETAYGVPIKSEIFFFEPEASDDQFAPAPCQPGTDENPAVLTGNVCSASPDDKYHVELLLDSPDFDDTTIRAAVTICRAKPPCLEETDRVRSFRFTLTHFDFPLTDNTQIDSDHRFSVSLYSMRTRDDPTRTDTEPIIVKLTWFPAGFVSSSERPINYLTLRKTLGVDGISGEK